MQQQVFIGLGSNLEDPQSQVETAIREIAVLHEVSFIKASSLYKTAPVGFAEQPDFINAVIEITTNLSVQELLSALQQVEAKHKKVVIATNGPRTLDCDILLFGDKIYNQLNLKVPHPRMLDRAFVLVPLYELAPNLILPNKQKLQFYYDKCDKSQVYKQALETY